MLVEIENYHLVGHNCLYDLLFLFEHFEAPIPEEWSAFKALVRQNFPIIVDTKAFAPRCAFPERRTALDQLYEAVQTSQGAEIRFARGFGKYGPEESSEDESDEDGQVDDAARTAAFRAALDAPSGTLGRRSGFTRPAGTPIRRASSMYGCWRKVLHVKTAST